MESSNEHSSRKRKHSPASNYHDDTTSEVILKPGNRHKPNCFSELPEVVMQNIYRYLCSKDLFNMRDVCDSWKNYTDRTSVWKHVPFEVRDSNIENLGQTPYIHTVTGYCTNAKLYINAILKNLEDLRKLDITFRSYISTVYVQKLGQKFVNLESIKLDPSAPNILKTLAVLENCTKLKEIQFLDLKKPYSYDWKKFFDILCKIKSLDTFDFYPFCIYINHTDILYLLELKMKQLVKLTVHIGWLTNKNIQHNISTIVRKIICDGDRLEELSFSTSFIQLPADIILNFAEIKNLKTLKLWFKSGIQTDVIAQATFPISLEFLEVLFFSLTDTKKILQRIIESCPNLKYLRASYVKDEDINEQLEEIRRMKNLHTIILEHCSNLSGQGLRYISECSELRVLKLTEASIDDVTACDYLKSCKYLQEIRFENCNVKPVKLAEAKLYLERLTHLSLVQCYRNIGKRKVYYSDQYLKRFFINMSK